MKVGDLVRPGAELEGWEGGTYTWIGLVIAMLIDSDGWRVAVVNWNRDRFESEEEYCHQLKVINESR